MAERSEADQAISYSSRGNTRWIVLKGSRGRAVDRALVRYLGFSVITWQYAKAAGVGYRSTLLLTTIGRRSGRLRSRALPYHRDEARFVVVGSNGGGPKDPDWVWNVRGNGSAWVHVKRHKIPVAAHVAEGGEYERLFALIAEKGDSLPRYQERASQFGRTVPLVVLEPRGGSDGIRA
jgi:deazaflavin-dependent oxidoreductase (nitroreductase family)